MKEQLADLGLMALKVLAPIVMALLGLLAKKASDLLSARVKNTQVSGILMRLDSAAFNVVNEIQQSFIGALSATPTTADLVNAKKAAVASLLNNLGPTGITEIKEILGLGDSDAIEKVLGTYIESKVHNLKQNMVSNGVNKGAH